MDLKMRYFWSLLYFFMTADLVKIKSVSLSQSSVESGLVAATGPPWDINPATGLTLARKVQYSMNLNCSSSAALDSAILFEAELIPNVTDSEISPLTSDRFIYQWMDMASKQVVKTVDGLRSSITMTFASKNVKSGDYLMTVAAYLKDDSSTIVAAETRKFTLTEKLNGILIITQKLDYQKDPNIFSSKKPVTLTANIHDQFLQSGLDYRYYWCQGRKCSAYTKVPNYTATIFDVVNISLSTLIYISSSDSRGRFSDTLAVRDKNGSMTGTDTAVTDSSSADFLELDNNTAGTMKQDTLGKGLLFMAQGIFQREVTFKEFYSQNSPLENMSVSCKLTSIRCTHLKNISTNLANEVRACMVTRIDTDPEDRGISMRGTALVNVTCVGSAPSSICLNMTRLNTDLPSNRTCKPGSFVDKLDHQVHIKLTSTGWNDVHFFVYNDVSRYHLVESFYSYNPDSVNVPALTIPIVFGVLGIIVIITGGVYLMRLRKKPLVEVADFDFHPSLTSSQSQSRFQFSRVVTTIRSMFSRDQYETDHKRPLLRKPATYSRGISSSDSLYESL